MSVSTDAFDLVVEGRRTKVTDPATVANLAAIRAARRRVQRAFGRTTPWPAYRLTVHRATAVAPSGRAARRAGIS
jgi:hypothetical protein